MDSRTTGKPEGTGSHLWLHHTLQITVGGRTHTIEMDIPIPIGASANVREQLLNEAEASMEELAKRIESGAPRKLSLSQPAQPAKTPTAKQQASTAQAAVSKPSSTPASTSSTAAPSLLVPIHPRDTIPTSPPEIKEAVVPPTRPNIGASMPSSPGISVDTSGSLKLPQFILFIKESMDLTPKQAMELLNVKSLSGLNLREALEELQQIVGQEATNRAVPVVPASPKPIESNQTQQETQSGTTNPASPTRSAAASAHDTSHSAASSPQPPAAQSRPFPPVANPKNPDIIEIKHAVIHDNPPAYAFDEEIDLEQEIDLPEDEEVEFVPELTKQERELAEEVLIKLRDARGSSLASDMRLKVLHNVTDSQVSEEQEALSRGAASATFIELNHKMLAVVRENLSITGLADRAETMHADAFKFLQNEPLQTHEVLPAQRGQYRQHKKHTENSSVETKNAPRTIAPIAPIAPYDIIYVAPPQYQEMAARALGILDTSPLVSRTGLVIIQIHPKERDGVVAVPLKHLALTDERRYGSTLLMFFSMKEEQSAC